jgi:L-2,4-diaminobutyric acid acetyltransferase
MPTQTARTRPDEADRASDHSVAFRQPTLEDGAELWRLARATGALDMNSPYAYLLVGNHFSDTSVVAETGGQIAGFISGYEIPNKADTLFVWQVGVDPGSHGKGIGTRMLWNLLDRAASRNMRFLETTVTPSNEKSLALFKGIARRLGTECAINESIGTELFPGSDHEEELVLRIGPFDETSTREGMKQ